MNNPELKSTPRKNRTIVLPYDQDEFMKIMNDKLKVQNSIDQKLIEYPVLFPIEINTGYKMKDSYYSKKSKITTWRIEVAGVSYTVRPSFLMPYHTALTKDAEKGLLLRKFSVPYWALSYVFGKDPMYWYRMEIALGRNSIVGTTVNHPDKLPQHIVADEKHTRQLGEKSYIATTVGEGCVLGASVAQTAGNNDLKKAYSVFKEESQCLNSDYAPETVNTDGWKATQNAWKQLFPKVLILSCFLHLYIKFRDRVKKKCNTIFCEASSKFWDCYKATTKRSFSQRIRRLNEWCKKTEEVPPIIMDQVQKVRDNIDSFISAYDHPGAHRTSNMLDRLMQRMDQHLFDSKYFHGIDASAELGIRAWALIHNFAPSNPLTVKKYEGLISPAERLNQNRYHENWLQNLLSSASLGGYRCSPLNPL